MIGAPPDCRLSRLDEGHQPFDCFALHGGKHAVDGERHSNARVSESFLDDLGIDVGFIVFAPARTATSEIWLSQITLFIEKSWRS